MKKTLTKCIALALASVTVSSLVACKKTEETPPPPVPDYNNVVISGLDDIMIDRETETLDFMDGVTATYTYEDGSTEVLTDEVRVVLPSSAKLNDGEISFSRCGDYELTYYINDDKGNNTATTRFVQVRDIYNCYWLTATLPVLYSALDMASNNYKSLLAFYRTDTLDIDALDDDRFIYKVNGAGDADFRKGQRMAARIANENEWSYFRLFMVDVYSHTELVSMQRYGISSDRYEVKLLSDGSYTYEAFKFYKDENTYSGWQDLKTLYDGVMDKALKGEFTAVDNDKEVSIEYNGETITTGIFDYSRLDRIGLIAAQRDNVELWCKYPETLVSNDPLVQAEVDKAHKPKKAPDEMYKALTDEQKEFFLDICGFDKAEFDAQYFTEEGEYLIITGTNPFTGSLTDAEYASILQKIIADYSNYNILYKPHPSALAPTSSMPLTAQVINDNNIKILPGRLPMEVISWVYSDAKIGGFDSSLYMAVPQGNTAFFITQDQSTLSTLTRQLHTDGVFGELKFYWKDVA